MTLKNEWGHGHPWWKSEMAPLGGEVPHHSPIIVLVHLKIDTNFYNILNNNKSYLILLPASKLFHGEDGRGKLFKLLYYFFFLWIFWNMFSFFSSILFINIFFISPYFCTPTFCEYFFCDVNNYEHKRMQSFLKLPMFWISLLFWKLNETFRIWEIR